MPPIESPLNTAHQHAANAEEYVAQGLLIPAAEEHYKAAEAFLACVEASSEENTKRTLRMLYSEHCKAGKELQRKIAKLREENKDPSLPQKPLRALSTNPSATSGPVTSPMPPASPPPTTRNNLSDSQQMVDESFMLLGHRSESNDAFNQFWKITEGMLNYLSQPVAFATAPLSPPENSVSLNRREPGSSSDTDIEDPITRRLSRGVGFMKSAKSKMVSRHGSSNASDSEGGRAGINTFPPKPLHSAPIDDWDDDVETYDDMADSFCLIPSKSEPSVTSLKKENLTLKADLEEAQKQLALAERTLKQRKEQDLHLRDSIMLARKEAQRAMSSSIAIRPPAPPPVDLASLAITTPPVPAPVAALNPTRDREAQLVRRVRELEDELRVARVENEKQKAMIVKFRERWEKLKESAKRKKQAKAAAEATSVVGDRIEEEPEAEAEAEKNDSRAQSTSDSLTAT